MAQALPYVIAAATAKTAYDSGQKAKAAGAQQAQAIEKQTQVVQQQQQQVQQQQSDMAARTTASIRARRGGGLRSLLSSERMSETGLPAVSKLGGE